MITLFFSHLAVAMTALLFARLAGKYSTKHEWAVSAFIAVAASTLACFVLRWVTVL